MAYYFILFYTMPYYSLLFYTMPYYSIAYYSIIRETVSNKHKYCTGRLNKYINTELQFWEQDIYYGKSEIKIVCNNLARHN